MHDDLHARTKAHVAPGGRTVISIVKIYQAQNHRKTLKVMHNQEMEPPNSLVP